MDLPEDGRRGQGEQKGQELEEVGQHQAIVTVGVKRWPSSLPSRSRYHGTFSASHRAFLRSIGFSDEEVGRPLGCVVVSWREAGPCNYHTLQLVQHVKEGYFLLSSLSYKRFQAGIDRRPDPPNRSRAQGLMEKSRRITHHKPILKKPYNYDATLKNF